MLIWLASYPRSGNTFMRLLLSRSFILLGKERSAAVLPLTLGLALFLTGCGGRA